MNPVELKIEVRGIDEAEWTLQAIRTALADRRELNARLGTEGTEFTRAYMVGTPRHRTAERLGAVPTGHRERSARALQADWDADGGIIRIPRSTGLGRAFGEVTIKPGPGRKYLTIPAHQETYGRHVRDFPEDSFEFRVIESWMTFLALVWKETSGRHEKGEVAYWLRRSVKQKQDRTLLPSDDGYREVGRRVCVAYIANLVYKAP